MQWNGTFHSEFAGKSMEAETTTRSVFPNGGKVIVEQILPSEEIKKSRRAGLWESQSGTGVGKLTIWVRSFKIEKLPESYSQSLWWTSTSPKTNKHYSRWVDREMTSMLVDIESTTAHKDEKSDRYRKKK